MSQKATRQRGTNGRYLPAAAPDTAAADAPATSTTVEPARQSLEVPPGLVEFTRTDPLTGWPYTGRGVVVSDLGTGVLVVAPIADHTVQVDAGAVRAIVAGE